MFVLSMCIPSCKQSCQVAGSQQHSHHSSNHHPLIPCTADVGAGSNPQARRGQAHPTNCALAMPQGPQSSLDNKVAAAGRPVATVAGACLLCWFCALERRHSAWRQGCTYTSPAPHAAAVFCAVHCCGPGALPFQPFQVRHCIVS